MKTKLFSSQFKECRTQGVQQDGPEVTDVAVRFKTEDGKWHRGPKEITRTQLICGKFGGECSSQNPGCKKLRGTL